MIDKQAFLVTGQQMGLKCAPDSGLYLYWIELMPKGHHSVLTPCKISYTLPIKAQSCEAFPSL